MTMSSFLDELEKAATAKGFKGKALRGTRPTVIVVDEANALKQMSNQAV